MNNNKVERSITLEGYQLSEASVYDPIKLFLAHALRYGLGWVVTLREVLENVYQHVDDQVTWTQPEWSLSSNIVSPNPGFGRLASGSLRQLEIVSRILTEIIPHDLRRGSAKDLAQLPNGGPGIASAALSKIIRHTVKSAKARVTGAYCVISQNQLLF